MKKLIVFFLIATVLISGCKTKVPSENRNTTEKIQQKDKTEYTENNGEKSEKKTVSETPKKEESKPEKVDKPVENEKPPEDKPDAVPDTVEISVVDKKAAQRANTGHSGSGDTVKDPKYVVSSSYQGPANLVNVINYGAEEVSEAEALKHHIIRMSIDDSGENLLFVPSVYGGTFKIHRIEYDTETKDFQIRDEIYQIQVEQDDAVNIKMILPETIPSIMITYEKEGEYLVQTIPTYDGHGGGIKLNKGFKAVESN